MKKLKNHILSTYKEAGQKWLDSLPELIKKCAQLWQLEQLTPFNNLSWNYVARGTRMGQPVVLKVGFDIPTLKREVSALKVFSPESCVAPLEFDEVLGAALLESADPGTELMSCHFESSLTPVAISCDMAMAIRACQNPTKFSFKRVVDLFQNLDKSWGQIPFEMLRLARLFKAELVSDQRETYIIHGDLHRQNILSHGTSWRVIDPKGYVGTLYNEVWPFIHEPQTEIPFSAQRLGLDEKLLFKWCFIHSILSATWCFEDGVDPKNILGLGEKILPLCHLA